MPITPAYKGRTVVCIGTGPSLRPEQIAVARSKGFVLLGCNNTWELTQLDVLYACNRQWWDYYWSEKLAAYPASKWTTNGDAASDYGLNWVAEANRPGLSQNPECVHHGHGSGFTLLGLAYLMGAAKIVLLGYDLTYAADYEGRTHHIGSSPRHYWAGGEYPDALQHWPSVKVHGGVHEELLGLYQSVADQHLVEIVNATGPASALNCFPRMWIDDERL